MDIIKSICINQIQPSPKTFTIGLLIIFIVFFIWNLTQELKTKYTKHTIDQQCQLIPTNETIFVSIPSLSDPQCAETIHDLFEKAYCPFRITVGVCQHNSEIDQDVLTSYKLLAEKSIRDFSDRIRMLRFPVEEAKGSTHARHLIETKLFRNEQFYLIIDSHTLFTPHWDKKLVEEWNSCKQYSKNPIITSYPSNCKPFDRTWTPSEYDIQHGNFTRIKQFDPLLKIPQLEGVSMNRNPSTPLLGLFWSKRFSFSDSSIIKQVPFDPHYEFMFSGEEWAMTVRLWTSGYDFFHPTTSIIYHMWNIHSPLIMKELRDHEQYVFQKSNSNSPSKSFQSLYDSQLASYKRLHNMLGIIDNQVTIIPPFGLGNQRSLNEYEQFIGFQFSKQQLLSLSGLLGLPDQTPSSDILCRFGTWKQFEFIKNNISKQLNN